MNVIRQRFSFNGRVFNPDKYPDNRSPIFSHGTTCCALTVMSVQNYHSVEDIRLAIKEIQEHSLSNSFSPSERNFGERNIMVITTPSEVILEEKLKEAGFDCIQNGLNRRRGYPKGQLKMWLYCF